MKKNSAGPKMHFKAIRASHRGSTILAAETRGWLLTQRKVEIAFLKEFGPTVAQFQQTGRCTALIMPTIEVLTEYGRYGGREAHLCGLPAVQRGFCSRHFITHVLYLPDRQTERRGRGVSRRPFQARQFPCGRLSEAQIDMMSDLERLPLPTPLEECLAQLNAADPGNPLEAIPPRQK